MFLYAVTFAVVDRFYHNDHWNRIKFGYNLRECNQFQNKQAQGAKKGDFCFLRGKRSIHSFRSVFDEFFFNALENPNLPFLL